MTDTYFTAPTGVRKAVLACMAAGLVLMLLASLMSRMNNPSLVVEANPPRGMAQGGGQGGMEAGGMNPEVGALMRKIAENPQDLASIIHLTEHLISDQQWEPAETFARRAMTVAPANPQPPYLLGVTLHNMGRHAEAAEALERVIAIKDDASARYSLGVLNIYFLKNNAKGIEHLKAALADPNAPEQLKKNLREELDKAAAPAQ